MTERRARRPTLFSLWRKARRENSVASRLLGTTSCSWRSMRSTTQRREPSSRRPTGSASGSTRPFCRSSIRWRSARSAITVWKPYEKPVTFRSNLNDYTPDSLVLTLQ